MPNLEYNYSDKQLALIRSGSDESVQLTFDDLTDSATGVYVRMGVFDDSGRFISSFYSNVPDTSSNHLVLDKQGETSNILSKPNESFQLQQIPSGKYTLRFDVLYNPQQDFIERQAIHPAAVNPRYIVKQISPSRKEIRLIPAYDGGIAFEFNDNFQNQVSSSLGVVDENTYTFNWIIGASQARNIPIVNYVFDETTAPTSLILRLNTPLPSDITLLDEVTIEQELVETHTDNILYEGGVYTPDAGGTGLDAETHGGLIPIDVGGVADNFQTYADLTGSFSDNSLVNFLLSGSDPNLNINYNNFSKHAFFGSAVSKIENFKTKVSTIEDYLVEISKSLSSDGSIINVQARRKELFDKIQTQINTFTPYERFLYYDNQSVSTGSAPGLGMNFTLGNDIPVASNSLSKSYSEYEGIKNVYKLSPTGSGQVHLFTDKYRAEEKPFFNFSGSVYLSFLAKGVSGSNVYRADGTTYGFEWENYNENYHAVAGKDNLPASAFSGSRILEPTGSSLTGSAFQRFIFAASQSYWAPLDGVDGADGHVGNITDWSSFPNSQYQILSGSNVTGSTAITVPNEFYQGIANIITSSGVPFVGTLMPAGELFRLSYYTSSAFQNSPEVTSSFITDIKITKNNPLNVLPFSYIYSTGSSQWTSWYSGMHASASVYDDNNIHSFTNNLPETVRDDTESDTLKTFINMTGEHFDLIKCYIDNYLSFYKRKYSSLESVPSNLLPILVDGLGWELIQPFSSSFSSYFGTSEQDSVSERSTIESVTISTWRKVLNNLLYLYKTKGTKASIHGLLNVYGHLPDIIIQEGDANSPGPISQLYDASDPGANPNPLELISNTTLIPENNLSSNPLLINISNRTDVQTSYAITQREMYSYIFNRMVDRTLNFDWWTNDAINLDTIEFVYKPQNTANNQNLVESSGSGTEKLWDLRLVSSASSNTRGKFEFRLNNTYTGSGAIASNAVSMSTDYLTIGQGRLWNVMLQRLTSSVSGTGIQNYRLAAALQDVDSISQFSAVSMSVSGGTVNSYITGGADSNFYANQNWQVTGSLGNTVSGNLFLGTTATGSIAEFRAWNQVLNGSKFLIHVLNKKSVIGNGVNSSFNNLVYRYRLEENYDMLPSSSIPPSQSIVDGNPNTVKDFTKTVSMSFSVPTYTKDIIWVTSFTSNIGSAGTPPTSLIFTQPSEKVYSDLNTVDYSVTNTHDSRVISTILKINKSPRRVLDNLIVDQLSFFDKDTETLFDKISEFTHSYEDSYPSLDKFRDDFFRNRNVSFKINKWMDAQGPILQQTLQSTKKLVPAKATTFDVGVELDPSILERTRLFGIPQASIHTGSAVPYIIGDMGNMTEISYNLSYSKYTPSLLGKLDYVDDTISVTGNQLRNNKFEIKYIDNFFESQGFNNSPKVGEDITVNDIIDIQGKDQSPLKFDEILLDIIHGSPSGEYQPITEGTAVIDDLIDYQAFNNAPKVGENITVNDIIDIQVKDQSPLKFDEILLDIIHSSPSGEMNDIVEGDDILLNNIIDLLGKDKSPTEAQEILLNNIMDLSGKDNSPTEAQEIIIDDIVELLAKDNAPKQGEKINLNNIISLSDAQRIPIYAGSGSATDYYLGTKSFKNLADSWGRGNDDTHFVNPAWSASSATGYWNRTTHHNISESLYQNVAVYDQTYVYRVIGDTEWVSGSFTGGDNLYETDFSNHKNFKYKQIRDTKKGHVYKSYVKHNNNTEGPQKGRPVGKTSYYVTGSDGELIYPSNHWIHFSEDRMREMFIQGTQHIGTRFFDLKKHNDFSTASFYSVNVTGEDTLVVQRGKRIK